MKNHSSSHRIVRRARGGASALALVCGLMVGTMGAGYAQAVQAGPAAAVSPEAGAYPALKRAEIDALLAQSDKVLFLDVRRADEISEIGGFPVFLNIQNSELDRFLPSIPKDKKIVTVSNHAHRAQRAAAFLAGKGYSIAGAATLIASPLPASTPQTRPVCLGTKPHSRTQR